MPRVGAVHRPETMTRNEFIEYYLGGKPNKMTREDRIQLYDWLVGRMHGTREKKDALLERLLISQGLLPEDGKLDSIRK